MKSEDEVIDAVSGWFLKNLDDTEDKVMVEEIMLNVNWTYVSVERMLDLFKQFPRIRHNIHTKAIFHNQLKFRTFKRVGGGPDPHLVPLPRPSYDQLTIE